jgi:hypothetical protein
MSIHLDGGQFLGVTPCFQAAPFGEDLRDRLRIVSPREIQLQSPTTRDQAFAEDPTKALVCELEGGPESVLTVRLRRPIEQEVRARLADLVEDNVVSFAGPFTSESYIIHRLVGPDEFAATVRWEDRRPVGHGPDWYYVRASQQNGQMAWSSPIWVG